MSDETLVYHLAPQHENRNYRLCPEQGAKVVKMMVAEFIGTFIMVFGRISVAIVIFSTGHISGAHLNPAVTIAFALFKNFPFACVPLYIVAQVLGSICASTVLSFIFDPVQDGGVTVPTISTSRAFILEFVITFILLFVVNAMTFDSKANQKLAAIAVGLTVLLNSLIAGPSTGASMNPVRTLGTALVTGNYDRIWIYITAPILGAIFGTITYDYMR
ncbi:NOD26-like intrinsic protein 1 [Rhynchospora pubera]|uniref:NOD26-like intrinsic protein 1 n=1 Tax=Rhynchospora pubera TaxID=906938 RepID=A0AAV8DQL5_9POAL|nr:NOD26-like intrinsic protein 1 [Rhynchospora pubera]